MKILLINDYLKNVGGTEQFIYNLEANLSNKQHEVKIFGSVKNKEDFRSYFSRIYSFYWRLKTNEIIRNFKPDMIHLNNCSRIISISPIDSSMKNNIPIILTVHDTNYISNFKIKLSIKNIFKKIKIKLHKGVIKKYNIPLIAPSNFIMKKLENSFENPIYYIPNGISIPSKSTNYKKNILFVGRLSKEKGLQTVIKTLNEVKGYEVLVLGEGPLKTELESKYKNIKFLGFQKPEKFYQNASILVMPSICEESFGLSTAEAMSYGLGVIGSNIGATPELINNKETGLLFEPSNEQDFKEKLDYLIKNPKEIKRMGKNARAFVKKNFDWNKVVKEYEDLYKKVIEDFSKKDQSN